MLLIGGEPNVLPSGESTAQPYHAPRITPRSDREGALASQPDSSKTNGPHARLVDSEGESRSLANLLVSTIWLDFSSPQWSQPDDRHPTLQAGSAMPGLQGMLHGRDSRAIARESAASTVSETSHSDLRETEVDDGEATSTQNVTREQLLRELLRTQLGSAL